MHDLPLGFPTAIGTISNALPGNPSASSASEISGVESLAKPATVPSEYVAWYLGWFGTAAVLSDFKRRDRHPA
jgi:hypothetical protein